MHVYSLRSTLLLVAVGIINKTWNLNPGRVKRSQEEVLKKIVNSSSIVREKCCKLLYRNIKPDG